ncbi:MAG: iron-sulfur cluster assembly accessory protein [Saprospiraceae bacterium]
MKTKVDPITLTKGAIEAIIAIREKQEIPKDHGLRVGVKGGGCSGFSYEIGFDEVRDGDDVYEISGLIVMMQKTHALHLFGIEVDWMNGLNNRGFIFNNPNAKSTCGCGSSFST